MKTIFGTEIKNPTPEQLELIQQQFDIAKKSIDSDAKFRKIFVITICVLVTALVIVGIVFQISL